MAEQDPEYIDPSRVNQDHIAPDHIDAERGALRDADPTEQSALDRLSTEYREVD